MINVEEYLASHEIREIKNGKSGAEVWEVDGKYVLKHVRRERLPDPGVFGLYQNEAYFYQRSGRYSEVLQSCMPEVWEVQISDNEILICMKKYRELSGGEISHKVLRKIMGTLAKIHAQEPPAFLRRERSGPGYLGREQIEVCAAGWRSVLGEHPGAFDEKILEEAAARINEIIGWHHEEAQVLGHGDFHRENLLRRENGDIVVCDWQNAGEGGASGDISFFLSRLGAEGTDIEPGDAAELYCQERFLLTGEKTSPQDLLRHMKAANMITTFQFWHQYLHGSSCGRVMGIYEKMTMD